MAVSLAGFASRWSVSVALVAVVLVGGLTGSFGLVVAVNRQQQQHLAEVMDQRAQAVDNAVKTDVSRYVDTISDLSIAVGAQSDLSASDFSSLTAGLNRTRLPGVSGAALVVSASDREIPAVQQRWRAEGNHSLHLAPVGTGHEHMFAVLSHSLDGTANTTGRDLSQAAEPTQAMLSARVTQQVTASATYVLLKDRGLPVAQRQQSFVLVTPIYGGSGTPDAGAFRGWILIGLRGADFISESLRQASQDTVAVTLLDASAPASAAITVAHYSSGPVIDQGRLRREQSVEVAGRYWQLVVQPAVGMSDAINRPLARDAGLAGILFTVLLSALVASLSRSRNLALFTVRKATEALRADIQRRELIEAQLRAILANSQSLIYVKDLQGRYLLVNEPMLRARSFTEADLIGKDDTWIDPVMAPLWRANDLRAQQGEYLVEEWAEGPDGRRYYDSVKFPLFDGAGQVYATCGISLNVTARRQAAVAMTQARDAALAANAAKSSFLATMSHEIRTPMNAVIGMSDLLLDTDLDARQLDYVETVRTSGNALLAVINDILDFSRIEAGEMDLEEHPFDLRHCIEDSLSVTAAGAGGLEMIADVDAGCPRYICGDVHRLRQVLINLIGNAVKFTKKGDILVSVRVAQPAGDSDSGDSDRDTDADPIRLAFSVRDTGIGIPPDRMDRLFRSFSQVDASTTRVYGGTGLGLAISQAIVHAMGGQITVTSQVGVGSTFSFEIALASGDDLPEEAPRSSLPDLTGRRVLVVDDNDTNRRILRSQLETWGMTCTDLATPRAALAAFPAGARFDVAILDMTMPEIDGVQLAEGIRRLPGGQLPLVLLTSLSSGPRSANSELFAGFHTKPIRAGALRTMLGQILAPVAAEPVSVAVASSTEDSLRVLLAEDNLVNQRVAVGMLKKLGHTVTVAGDGQQALQAVQAGDYDVVLMDIHMPTMDGLQATEAIRAQLPADRQPRIIAMTASSLPEDQRACTQAGMDDYLLKPVRITALADTLRGIPKPRSAGSTSASDATDADPAVDLEVLDQLIIDMGAESTTATAELVGSYLSQAESWMAELAAAAQIGDLARIRVITHTLGSSSELLGAKELARLLARLHDLAEPDQVPANFGQLQAIAGKTVNAYTQVALALRAFAG